MLMEVPNWKDKGIQAYWRFWPYLEQDPQILTEFPKFEASRILSKMKEKLPKVICLWLMWQLDVIPIWYFYCVKFRLSFTIRHQNFEFKSTHCLKVTIDPYLRTITIPTYDRIHYLTPSKPTFASNHIAVFEKATLTPQLFQKNTVFESSWIWYCQVFFQMYYLVHTQYAATQ